MKHAKEPGQLNSLCGKPVKPYGRAKGRVQAIPAHLCWNVSQAKPMARESKAEWCGKCLAGMGLKPLKPPRSSAVKDTADAFGDLGPPYTVGVDMGGPDGDKTVAVLGKVQEDGTVNILDTLVVEPAAPEDLSAMGLCKGCGKPKLAWQVYCGAGCAARAGA